VFSVPPVVKDARTSGIAQTPHVVGEVSLNATEQCKRIYYKR